MSRLSDLSVQDDIKRVVLYRRILQYIAGAPADLFRYEVKTDERYRADLVSLRAYGAADLDWLILLVCGMDDSFAGLPAGYSITLPPMAEVRRLIREVRDAG